MGSTVTTRGIYEKDSIRAYVPDQDITAPWWASTAETWWKLAAENDYWMGGFVWTGFDYRGEPTPYQMAEYQFAFWHHGYVWLSKKYLLLLSKLVDR